MNIFRHSKDQPYHLSVGALVTNEKGEICTHYIKGPWGDGIEDTYILMRETVEPGESIDAAVLRGLREEFGITGTLVRYLGSIQSWFPRHDTRVEKTTLYFLVSCESIDPSLRHAEDVEANAETRWVVPEELCALMESQQRRYERTDLCEAKIIRAFLGTGQ